MKRTSIWLRPEHIKKLQALSAKTETPVSGLIRKAIEEYLRKK
jgi:predicted DNA-binding protein